mgnify:CR=1 FL=1
MIRVLLADDHTIFRKGLKEVLENEADIRVINETGSGREAVAQVIADHCDVILLDLSMPDTHGLNVLKRIKYARPDMNVIILSMHPDEHYGLRALRSGASGYLTKDCSVDELISAIRTAHEGKVHISRRLTELLADTFHGDKGVSPNEILSDRELQVLIMLASGIRNKQVAATLGVSPKTVHTYRYRILQKLNLESNAQLNAYARHHGLLD